ncbi:MAG: zeta toxin family protein [Nitrospira sp.]|nr:zeta toxin family protein [Nitrospira sp.]MBS0194385.1 zeta toxin family protein [Pseudomonadota bacterium]
MATDDRPTLHVIVGPNGAGKTTLYEQRLCKRFPDAEFVNADELAKRHYGHAAVTVKESKTGQRLAEERRHSLMAEGKSLVTESTFSHPSKIDLVRDAKAAGYRVAIYHVNVRSAKLSVDRVACRVDRGGHPVPEDKIRERYVRNQELIHEAAQLADRAYVFDNSIMGKPHTLAIELRQGLAVRVGQNIPRWARELYAAELQQYSAARQNRPAASFAEAVAIVRMQLHANARTFVARAGGRYVGEIIGETDLHTLQKIGKDSTVAHFTHKLDKRLAVGEHATVIYDHSGHAKVQREAERGPYADVADAWCRDPIAAAKAHPERASDMANASAMLRAARTAADQRGFSPQQVGAVTGKLQQRLAGDLEHGRPIPGLAQRSRATPSLER